MATPANLFAALLTKSFPIRNDLPHRCHVRLGIDGNQNDYSDVVETVNRLGATAELVAKLRDTHPIGRPHHAEFDRQIWTVMNEAAAFAWAIEVGGYGDVRFSDDFATTDVLVNGGPMIEAKTIDVSPEERRIKEQMAESSDAGVLQMRLANNFDGPHPNLLHNFQTGLDDALQKQTNQNGESLVVYFHLAGLDWPTDNEAAIEAVRNWAYPASTNTGARIVIWRSDRWNSPFLDTHRAR